jgi:hypothetical protein
MRDLFRRFERESVRCLLIGGQAAVLYGAADFTQDVDLWIEPTPRNLRALIRAMARAGARVYKLTPPLTVRNLRRGHGFHFRVRGAYVDVMGRPPRTPPYAAARRRAIRMRTPWGRMSVASIEDLVEMKKTNRLGDYDVITRLVQIRLAGEPNPGPRLRKWAARNTFRVEAAAGIRPAPTTRRLNARIAALMDRGRAYWLPRLRELRELRRRGLLLPEGLPVRRLLEAEQRHVDRAPNA